MPSIANGVLSDKAEFYWHLGDFRALYRFDQDYEQTHKLPGEVLSITDYLRDAWPDFIQNQLTPFGDLPVYIGLGNHELIPPKTRSLIVDQFADWLNGPAIRKQRLADDPTDHMVRTYYHWIDKGVDFITLDNATPDQFDKDQMKWLKRVLNRDEQNTSVRAIVVGMHEALPDSLSEDHSMNRSSEDGVDSGRLVYRWLVEMQKTKPVYTLASHSHFYMANIFNTDYIKKTYGVVLPGWIVGTAGAERNILPLGKADSTDPREHVYGYLVGAVSEDKHNSIQFTFHQLSESDVPAEVVAKFSSAFVHDCWVNNPIPK